MEDSSSASGDKIQSSLQYLHPRSTTIAQYHASQAGDTQVASQHEGEYESHLVEISNGRGRTDWSLDIHGFQLLSHSSQVDYYDDSQLQSIYNRQIQELIQSCIFPNVKEVHIFDHTRRSSSLATRIEKTMREPSTIIHNDYTAWSAQKRIQELLSDKCYSRFAIVNIWRPIHGTVENWPLAICDSTSVDMERDLVTVPRISKDGRKGEIQMAKYHPDHCWYYFPNMTPHEVLVFKTYDSLQSVNQYTIHTSFSLPVGEKGTMSRESLETRVFVLFD